MNVADAVADLSLIWKQAAIVFPYFDRQQTDWDSAYSAFLPRIMAGGSETELHLLLAEFINLLGDGHTDYLFPRRLTDEIGYLPFSLNYIKGDYYANVPDGEGRRPVKVTGLNGMPMQAVLEKAFRYIYHVENFSAPSRLHAILPFFLHATENELTTSAGVFRFDLAQTKPALTAWGPLVPACAAQPVSRGELDIRLYENGILYVKLDNFLYSGAADEVAAALRSAAPLRGVILDLRENIGGMTVFGARVAELLIDGAFHGCQKRTRTMTGVDLASASQMATMSREAFAKIAGQDDGAAEEFERCRKLIQGVYFEEYQDTYGAPEHRAMYAGPCVLLTSRNTVSAAEDFVAMFRSNHRATVIGAPTQGTTGTPLIQSLLCGGRARICSVAYRLLDGTEFIGSGIAPDIPAENDVNDYAGGRDAVLELALQQFDS